MRLKLIALAGAGALSLAVFGVAAQERTDRAAALEAALEKAAQTRPRLKALPVGPVATEERQAIIDWAGVRSDLALSARRDQSGAAAGRTFAAAPSGVRAAPLERFKNVRAAEAAVPRLPVLVPADAALLGDWSVYGQKDAYSATASGDAIAYRISGARKKLIIADAAAARLKARSAAGQRPTLPGVGAPYVVSRSESSTDLSFSKFGAGYVLSLMCDDPADARCAEDGYAITLASNLALLNPNAGDGQ